MVEAERESTLVFSLERETDPGSGEYSAREVRAYSRKDGEVQLVRSSNPMFRNIGPKVSLVTIYKEGDLDRLEVDTIIEVSDVALEEPVVFEHKPSGAELIAQKISVDQHDKSLEMIQIIDGIPLRTGSMHLGFAPGEHFIYDLGKTPDGKTVRMNIYDARPQVAPEVPPVSTA